LIGGSGSIFLRQGKQRLAAEQTLARTEATDKRRRKEKDILAGYPWHSVDGARLSTRSLLGQASALGDSGQNPPPFDIIGGGPSGDFGQSALATDAQSAERVHLADIDARRGNHQKLSKNNLISNEGHPLVNPHQQTI
jgi:hypothetical protein